MAEVRRIFINKPLNDVPINKIEEWCISPYEVYLSTPGGSVSQGILLYQYFKYINPPTRIVAVGEVSSVGIIVLCAADIRCALPYTEYMAHTARFTLGDIPRWTEHFDNLAKWSRNTKSSYVELLQDAGITREGIVMFCRKEEYYFTNHEALKYNLVHQILT